jgi:hypothetical protein
VGISNSQAGSTRGPQCGIAESGAPSKIAQRIDDVRLDGRQFAGTDGAGHCATLRLVCAMSRRFASSVSRAAEIILSTAAMNLATLRDFCFGLACVVSMRRIFSNRPHFVSEKNLRFQKTSALGGDLRRFSF